MEQKKIKAKKTKELTGVDDTTELLLAEDGPSSLEDLVGTINVDLEDQVPLLIGHTGKGNILQDTGVVDDNINATEGLHGGLDNLLTIENRVVVGDGLSTGGTDLLDDNIGSTGRGSLAGVGSAKIVDDDRGTAGTESQSVGASESTTGTGDDDDTAVEAEVVVVSHYDLVDVIGMKKRRNGMKRGGERRKGGERSVMRKEKKKKKKREKECLFKYREVIKRVE